MRVEEVPKFLQVASMYQANIKDVTDKDVAAQAWYMALDVRLSLTDALDIAAHLASRGTRLHPSTVNEEFLLRIRDPHQQGAGRPRLPLDERRPVARRAPVAVGAPAPVRSDEVPEYVAARKAAHERKASAIRAWSEPCPYCHAEPGSPCVDGVGRKLTRRLAHPSREMAVAGA